MRGRYYIYAPLSGTHLEDGSSDPVQDRGGYRKIGSLLRPHAGENCNMIDNAKPIRQSEGQKVKFTTRSPPASPLNEAGIRRAGKVVYRPISAQICRCLPRSDLRPTTTDNRTRSKRIDLESALSCAQTTAHKQVNLSTDSVQPASKSVQ